MGTIPDKTIFDEDVPAHLEETTRALVERPILIMLDGADANQRHRIAKRDMHLGRDLMCEIVLNDTRCSRKHARLTYMNFDKPNEPPQVKITDLGSTNGIFVNGTKVPEQTLADRDKILLGSSLMGFFLRDDSELEADQRLFNLANNDALTGLRNRGFFNIEVRKEFERARRYGRNLSIVLFDIDHFKKFNDSYGHQTGDYVLQEIGRIVEGNIRGNDMAARYGGEEFAIILPETALEGALIQAERLRVSVMNHAFAREGTRLQLSISLGVASIEPAIRGSEEFIGVADRALYESKAQGRNRVSWYRNGKILTGLNNG